MKSTVIFGQKGSCFSADCSEIGNETYAQIKEFCKLRMMSGYPPDFSIIISSDSEIRYLTIGGVAGDMFPVRSRQNFSYQLEF